MKAGPALRKHLTVIAIRFIATVTAAAVLAHLVVLTPAMSTLPDRAFAWLQRKFGLQNTQILIAISMFATGTGAYFFKRERQRWYGGVEVVIGFLSALFVAGTLVPGKLDLAKWATLAGTAYVVARGWENFVKGRRSQQPQPQPASEAATAADRL